MKLLPVIENKKHIDRFSSEGETVLTQLRTPSEISKDVKSPFIEANTKDVSLSCLQNDCIIPVFARDNEKTIAHQEFIELTMNCVAKAFPNQNITPPKVRDRRLPSTKS